MPVMYRRAKPLPYYKFDPYILHVVAEFSFDFFFREYVNVICMYLKVFVIASFYLYCIFSDW